MFLTYPYLYLIKSIPSSIGVTLILRSSRKGPQVMDSQFKSSIEQKKCRVSSVQFIRETHRESSRR